MIARRLALVAALAAAASLLPTTASADAGMRVLRKLPFAAHHIAVYWKGHPDARVRVAVGNGRLVDAGRDDLGEQLHNGNTYGAVLEAGRGKTVRILSNEPLAQLKLVAIPDHPLQTIHDTILPKKPAAPGQVARPAIMSRADWGANESLRFSNGKESWPPAFARTQKLIVHHTDTANNDPNPASTVRAIYYYHAITQGWGDIGYNFLIDESGRIYKGRNSHAPGSDADTINGQNAAGEGVTGAHARNYNSGSVGVALLGTLSAQDATPAAKNALENLLAWEASVHHIDPHGSTSYPNIAGHRDVGQTDCPGGAFYARLPAIRDAVAARMSAAG